MAVIKTGLMYGAVLITAGLNKFQIPGNHFSALVPVLGMLKKRRSFRIKSELIKHASIYSYPVVI